MNSIKYSPKPKVNKEKKGGTYLPIPPLFPVPENIFFLQGKDTGDRFISLLWYNKKSQPFKGVFSINVLWDEENFSPSGLSLFLERNKYLIWVEGGDFFPPEVFLDEVLFPLLVSEEIDPQKVLLGYFCYSNGEIKNVYWVQHYSIKKAMEGLINVTCGI